MTNAPLCGIIIALTKGRLCRGIEQLVARRAHNPEVVRFESHSRNHKETHLFLRCVFLCGFCSWPFGNHCRRRLAKKGITVPFSSRSRSRNQIKHTPFFEIRFLLDFCSWPFGNHCRRRLAKKGITVPFSLRSRSRNHAVKKSLSGALLLLDFNSWPFGNHCRRRLAKKVSPYLFLYARAPATTPSKNLYRVRFSLRILLVALRLNA